jgi:hypothetical protein
MKRRHLVVGFAIVLSISLAVPALGAGGLAGIKALAKKALGTANTAESTAAGAQQTAGNAQDASKTAQNTAGTAVNKANAAEAAATAAQGTANAAQGTANAAQAAANTAQGTANTAKNTADGAAAGLAGKFGHIKKTEPAKAVANGNNIKEGRAECPEGTQVIAGGYEFTSGTAEVHIDIATTNGWRVQAQSGGDPYEFSVYAICVEP